MPQSIPAGLRREHVYRALADLDAGVKHAFGTPTGYELVFDDKRYPPKAVIGLACQYSIGRVLEPHEFSGGESPGQANFVLRKLGFTVVSKADPQQENQVGKDWSQTEVQLIVTDYFEMLETELKGKEYKKSEHRKKLVPQLSGRSEGSIEFKHQNISSVLVERGLPYIEGYKPRSNYQSILATEVESFLDQRPEFLDQLALAPALNPSEPASLPEPKFDDVIEDPPDRIYSPAATTKPWLSRKVRKIDFAERDAANRRLAKLGEEFVVDLEKHRLNLAGRDDLARKVMWASRDIGDGLGFDILSFDEADDSEQMLEVKATSLGKFFPFYVTSNEVRCSEDVPYQYHVYRVFNFARLPRLYILHGSLREVCRLEPVLYRAAI